MKGHPYTCPACGMVFEIPPGSPMPEEIRCLTPTFCHQAKDTTRFPVADPYDRAIIKRQSREVLDVHEETAG